MKVQANGGLTDSYAFTTTEEQGGEKGDTASDIGVSAIVQTTVDSISIAGKPPRKASASRKRSRPRHPSKHCDGIKMPKAAATPATAKAPAKRQDNEADAAPGSSDAAPGGTDAEWMGFTYEELFGDKGEDDDECYGYNYVTGDFTLEECS
ncbi:hypothetical protein KI688_004089 [Linnemannia hyalina]|uniref:Uncharacterized protein n=1 Tax=Linnemannia hyalina TaxID=64524 RepID=A0A9P7XME2_9FUNG|nr:hypothetical protein KI688_004089 [Linnemannia hyalina]